MPIDTKDSIYQNRESQWDLMADLMEGEDAVKSAGTQYLPKLSGQDDNEYWRYKDMGYLYNATGRTRAGLSGAVMRKLPTYVVPEALAVYMNRITIDQASFPVLVADIINRLLTTGFFGILSDVESDSINKPIPYLSIYNASSIISCRTTKINGREKYIHLVLMEEVEKESADPYVLEKVPQIRELFLEPLPDSLERKLRLVVQLWKKEEKPKKDKKEPEWIRDGAPTYPTRFGGLPMDEIPFVFYGAVKNSRIPSDPPLYDLAKVNIKHYKTSCDYYYGLHYCALPTPYAFGIKIQGAKGAGSLPSEFYIGPGKAVISSDPNSRCGYMEFGGQGLSAVRIAMQDLKQEMVVLGAKVLEEPRAMVESAEAISLRGQGDSASLGSIVSSSQEGLKQNLTYLCYWMSVPSESIDVQMNSEWVNPDLSPDKIRTYLQLLQAGEISQDTFLYLLIKGELLPPGRTADEEKALIEQDDVKRMRDLLNSGGGQFFNEEDNLNRKKGEDLDETEE